MPTVRLSTRTEAASRLHLGFLDPDGSMGRRFGSIGLAIEGLPTIVSATPAAEFAVAGHQAERARGFAEGVLRHYGLPATIAVSVDAVPPPHAGLGSGTQLALATGTAVLGAFGQDAPVSELATVTARGKRSGTGLSLFERGGLVVDGGHGERSVMPPVVSRLEFPDDWFAVLVLDRRREGLSGAAETAAFSQLSPMPRATAAHLCHLTLMGLLPAVAERDFAAFCTSVAEVQSIVGDYFAPAQAGRYASANVRRAIDHCVSVLGLSGVGQSSWGPTGFVFVEGRDQAVAMRNALAARFDDDGALGFLVCAPRNRGAIRTSREVGHRQRVAAG